MHLPTNPTGIAAPASHYNHAFYIEAGATWITLSGQLGERPDGECPESVTEQSELAWYNFLAILAEEDFSIENVDTSAYLPIWRHDGTRTPLTAGLVPVLAAVLPDPRRIAVRQAQPGL